MVTEERGQVLLVGAVVLAVTLIAIVTLLNGVAYTEHVGGGEQDSIGEAKRVEQSVAADLESMSVSVGDGSASASQPALKSATGIYASRMSEMRATNRAAVISVEYSTAAATGTAIVHDDPNTKLVPNNGVGGTGSSWKPVMPSEESQIESFDISLVTSDIPQPPPSPTPSYEPFGIAITEGSSPSVTRTIRINRTSLSSVTITVDSDDDGTAETTCTFAASSRLDIDLVEGQVEGQSCSFTSLADTSNEYTVELLGAGPFTPANYRWPEGTYKIVLSDSSAVSGSHPRYSDGGAPKAQTEVTTAVYSFVYETPTLRYESAIEVEVDPDS